ncbi:hypothetical protein RI054_44g153300 [Pseudoscourfieldia marina]
MGKRNIKVGSRVSAGGDLLQLQEGQKRRRRARRFGIITKAVDLHKWSVAFDDGGVEAKTSHELEVEDDHNVGLPVITPSVIGITMLPPPPPGLEGTTRVLDFDAAVQDDGDGAIADAMSDRSVANNESEQ